MQLSGRHVVVTGGAGGIGSALSARLSLEGARALVVADRELAGAEAVATEIGALAVQFDASREESVRQLIARATEANGPIDIFISNAGVPGGMGGPETADETWEEAWRVNVLAHVWAARALLPEMVQRGEGYLINTASAAGLLTQVSAAALLAGGVIEPEEVAEAVVQGIADERLLILPHGEVSHHMALKGSDPERWIAGMRRLVRGARAGAA